MTEKPPKFIVCPSFFPLFPSEVEFRCKSQGYEINLGLSCVKNHKKGPPEVHFGHFCKFLFCILLKKQRILLLLLLSLALVVVV